MIDDLVHLVTTGKSGDKGSAKVLVEALTHWQAKLDLVQVGVTLHEINRVSKLVGHVATVEKAIFDNIDGEEFNRIDVMESKDLISLMKAMHAEYRSTVEFTSRRATQQTISSTETMCQIPQQQQAPVADTARLPAESRNAVRGYLEHLTARIQIIDAEEVRC